MSDERDYLQIIAHGLPLIPGNRKRVAIVGAGMAGLTAAAELLRAGHDPIILEAQQRVGGRVYTLREPFAPGLYAEAGAMRIPRSHKLTLAYVEKFGLETVDFTMNSPNAWCHLFGRKHRFHEVEARPHLIGAHLGEHERGATCNKLWERALKPFVDRLATLGNDGWPEIVGKFDGYSIREFLEERGWSEAAIELFGLLMNQESLMNTSFLELLREEVGHFYVDMVRIDGGMDCRRRVCAVRAKPAIAALRQHHHAGRPYPFRRRALFAPPCVDPGRHRVRAARGGGDQRAGGVNGLFAIRSSWPAQELDFRFNRAVWRARGSGYRLSARCDRLRKGASRVPGVDRFRQIRPGALARSSSRFARRTSARNDSR